MKFRRRINELSAPASPQFKAWFGNSKVVDASGQPLRVYHGSDAAGNIEEFLDDFLGIGNDQYGAGFYFTDKPEAASAYAAGMSDRPPKGNGGVIPVYLRITNPIRLGVNDNFSDGIAITAAQAFKIISQAPDLYDLDTSPIGNHIDIWSAGKVTDTMVKQVAKSYTNPEHIRGDFFDGHTPEFLKAFQQVTGYDGVIKQTNDGDIYVVFNGRQVKSATGNSGDFNPDSPKLTDATVAEAQSIESMRAQWKEWGLDCWVGQSDRTKTLDLSQIVVPKGERGKGLGTRFMKSLCDYADSIGYRVTLTPSTDFGGSSVSRLREFYKRFGFVDNKGRNKDYTTLAAMYRDPAGVHAEAEADVARAMEALGSHGYDELGGVIDRKERRKFFAASVAYRQRKNVRMATIDDKRRLAKTRMLPVKDLLADPDNELDPDIVGDYQKDLGSDGNPKQPPLAYEIDGVYMLVDGHHRAVAQARAGRTEIPVAVIDLSDYATA